MTEPMEPSEPAAASEPAAVSEPGVPSGRSRRTLVLAVLALVALVAAGAFLLFGGDDDDDDDGGSGLTGDLPAAPTVPPPVTGSVSEEAEELIALLDRGEEGRYHAVYEVQGDPAVTGGTTTLELWRDGGRSRRDTHVTTADGAADTVGIVDAEGRAISCSRIDEGDWTCFEAPSVEEVEGTVIGSIRSQLTGAEVTPRDDEIDGRAVRCFAFGTPDGPAEICATEEGVVVLLGSGPTALRLIELDAEVPGDIFTPPAELSEPPPPPEIEPEPEPEE